MNLFILFNKTSTVSYVVFQQFRKILIRHWQLCKKKKKRSQVSWELRESAPFFHKWWLSRSVTASLISSYLTLAECTSFFSNFSRMSCCTIKYGEDDTMIKRLQISQHHITLGLRICTFFSPQKDTLCKNANTNTICKRCSGDEALTGNVQDETYRWNLHCTHGLYF